VDEV
jgi:hypothetical protein